MLRLPALLVVAAVSALDFQEEQVEWVKPEVTGAVPEPREGHCAHLVQQSLYIYGGSTHTPMDLHDMHVLDLGNMNWASIDTCAANDATCYVPPKASRIACSSSGAELYTFGGYRGEYMNTVAIFDAETLAWRAANPAGEKPHGRQGASLTRMGDRFVMFGGATDWGTFNDVYLLERDGSAWIKPDVTGEKPEGREGHTAALIGTSTTSPKLWIFGGKGKVNNHYEPLSDLHYLAYDAHTDSYSWHDTSSQMVAGANFTARSFHSAAVLGARMMFFGGMAELSPRKVLVAAAGRLLPRTSPRTPCSRPHPARTLLHRTPSSFSPLAPSPLLTIHPPTHPPPHAHTHPPSTNPLTLSLLPFPQLLGDTTLFDADTFHWSSPVAINTPPPRAGQSITVHGPKVYLFGGCARTKCSSDLYVMSFKYVRQQQQAADAAAGLGVGTGGCPNSCYAEKTQGRCWQDHCLCSPGFEGLDCGVVVACPSNCTARGTCSAGRCYCDPGYEGDACEVEMACPAQCSQRGICQHGKCNCQPGYTGANCSEVAECPHGCSDRGICINGMCACVSGYSGADCSETLPCEGEPPCNNRGLCHRSKCFCAPGFAGADCSEALPCPDDCKDSHGVTHGQCVHGECWCDPGYAGRNCSEVARCPNDCSLLGVCFQNKCECEPGFGGEDCSVPLFQCLGNCSGHGACRYGVCLCDPGWTGESCAQPLYCPRDCSKHGICFNGHCLCEEGWGGADCASEVACVSGCSGHGVCDRGECSCDLEWAGVDCAAPRLCPNDCSGKGVCAYGKCFCEPGASGVDCAESVGCAADGPTAAVCGGHGVCKYGRCFCTPGYYGRNCTIPIECPHDCGGPEQGVCANGRCYCSLGWSGEDCTTEDQCPSTADGQPCGGRGRCERGQCVCDVEYTGDACEVEVTCPHDCRGNGLCFNGQCRCYPGFEGEECERTRACEESCNSHGTCRCARPPLAPTHPSSSRGTAGPRLGFGLLPLMSPLCCLPRISPVHAARVGRERPRTPHHTKPALAGGASAPGSAV